MLKFIYVSFLGLFFVITSHAIAERSLSLFPVSIVTSYTELGATPTSANTLLYLSVRNLSSKEQNLKIILSDERFGAGSCGTFGSGWITNPDPSCSGTFSTPTPLNLAEKLMPLESKTIELNWNCALQVNGGLFNCSRNGSATGAAGMPRVMLTYVFTMTIKVTENLGAVVGSLSTFPSTGGAVMPGQAFHLTLNGGRPF